MRSAIVVYLLNYIPSVDSGYAVIGGVEMEMKGSKIGTIFMMIFYVKKKKYYLLICNPDFKPSTSKTFMYKDFRYHLGLCGRVVYGVSFG